MPRLFGFIVLLGCCTGCICDRDNFRLPDILHPGHISEQQARMERFDPFTRNDIGPKIDGDRPSGSLDAKSSEQKLYNNNTVNK